MCGRFRRLGLLGECLVQDVHGVLEPIQQGVAVNSGSSSGDVHCQAAGGLGSDDDVRPGQLILADRKGFLGLDLHGAADGVACHGCPSSQESVRPSPVTRPC